MSATPVPCSARLVLCHTRLTHAGPPPGYIIAWALQTCPRPARCRSEQGSAMSTAPRLRPHTDRVRLSRHSASDRFGDRSCRHGSLRTTTWITIIHYLTFWYATCSRNARSRWLSQLIRRNRVRWATSQRNDRPLPDTASTKALLGRTLCEVSSRVPNRKRPIA